MPYEKREDYTKGSGAPAAAGPICGALTKKGTPCRWPKDECPVEWHKTQDPTKKLCGAPTRAGGYCRWPANECEYHGAWKAAQDASSSGEEQTEEELHKEEFKSKDFNPFGG